MSTTKSGAPRARSTRPAALVPQHRPRLAPLPTLMLALMLALQGCASGSGDTVIRPRLAQLEDAPATPEGTEVEPGAEVASPTGPTASTLQYLILTGAAEGFIGVLVGSDDLRDHGVWAGTTRRPDELSVGDLTSGALYGAMRGLLRGDDPRYRTPRWRLGTAALGPNAGTVRIRR